MCFGLYSEELLFLTQEYQHKSTLLFFFTKNNDNLAVNIDVMIVYTSLISLGPMELANDRTNEENTHLFKKVGSNFKILDRTVLFEPRGAWKTLLDSEFGGGNSLVSALRADPILHSEILFEKLRYLLDKVRIYFANNPNEEI